MIKNAPDTICHWQQDSDEGSWDTECGNRFDIIEGTPLENRMVYCCYCGKVCMEKYNEEESEE